MTAFAQSESTGLANAATSPAERGVGGGRFPLPTAEIERIAEAMLAAAKAGGATAAETEISQAVGQSVTVRRSEDGIWRGRILFGAPDTEAERSTAEIFCASSEPDLWQSVRDLRDHHLRDLYRSLL